MKFSTFLTYALALACVLTGASAGAQVATAPLVPDQRLVNPAVLAYRVLRGYTLSLHREIEQSHSLEGAGSTLGIDTTVDTVGVNFDWANSPYYFETNLLPQTGERTTRSNFTDATGAANVLESKRQITLVPVQGLFAIRLGDFASIGAKVLYTNANFNIDDKYGYNFDQTSVGGTKGSQSTTTTGTRSAGFLTASLGGVLNVFDTGLYLAYSSEFLQLKDDVDSNASTTITSTGGASTSTNSENKKTTTTLRKDIMGVGYLLKFSGGNVWRIDVSQEKMPAMSQAAPDGKLTRLVTEATWSFFHAGVQVTSTSGYYIDPYNLIPYFFSTQDLTAESVIEYGFFGGLKSSKGHSFGLSYSRSSQNKVENLGGSQAVTLATDQTSYGLSYMYVF